MMPTVQRKVAVLFLADQSNRFSINALTGAIEQDPRLSEVTLQFVPPAPGASLSALQALREQVGSHGTVVVACSFMTAALPKMASLLDTLKRQTGTSQEQVRFVAGGAHASGDAAGTLRLGFDVVFIGEGEWSFCEFLVRLLQGQPDPADIPGVAVLGQGNQGQRVLRTGRPPLIELTSRYPSIGVKHRRLGAIEIGRGCPHACRFCQTPFLHGARMRHRALENVLEHIEQLVRAGFKDIRFITPDALAYLSDDGMHPQPERLEVALRAMREVAGGARLKFGEFPSEMRPEYITPEIAQLLDRCSDAAYFAIGAQTGSERLLAAMHREHGVEAVEQAVRNLARYCHNVKRIYVDFIAGLPGETEQDEAASRALMERLTSISPKVCIHSHTFMPLPGTPLQDAPPGSVGKTTRAIFTHLAQRGQEWGEWQQQETLAQLITVMRRRPDGVPVSRSSQERGTSS
ncbi:MAG: TIGR04013 family B12-binding domain/radical SAM domain-containing protein [Thermogemmatispora sp.]|uniref:TIGR04013 family B12-binding domain/radical SAM domain-containing protein n=1 Tax=Thermogemmatispora sp. TaxID=1968838 RepID=UPI0026353EB6|nr:TIGR04013 family B12-binding domain/radical SAM domain-containing protein [Thermogemmatispora sp.]MBX5459295.1 TIGR04013 family B12-binding domain/radical SAM domain-containing protein [Thermogemmatispora sp.]